MRNEMLKKLAVALTVSSLCLSLSACGENERQSSLVDPSSTEDVAVSGADETSEKEESSDKDAKESGDSESNTESKTESKTESSSESESNDSSSSKQYTAGVNTDNSYESEFIGIKFDVPDGYVLTSQSEIDEQNAANASSEEENLKYMKYEANVVNSDQNFQMIIASDGEKGDYSEEDYIDIVAKSYTDTAGADVAAEIGTTEIAGKQYSTLDIDMSDSAKMKYCVRKEGTEMITFIFLSTSDLDTPMQELLSAIKPY